MHFVRLIFLLAFPALYPNVGQAQSVLVRGNIADEFSATPLSEVNVAVARTTIGISTDRSGQFSLIISYFPT